MPKSILLMFGEKEMLDLLKDVLVKDGYSVTISADGKDMLGSRTTFDLIISDISIIDPEDKPEGINQLHRVSTGAPMLLIGDMTDKPNWLKQAGRTLSKPVKMSHLKELVRQMIQEEPPQVSSALA